MDIFATKRSCGIGEGKGKHHAHVTATRRHLNGNKENQESPCNATCMTAVVLVHRKFHYARNTADTGGYLADLLVMFIGPCIVAIVDE